MDQEREICFYPACTLGFNPSQPMDWPIRTPTSPNEESLGRPPLSSCPLVLLRLDHEPSDAFS